MDLKEEVRKYLIYAKDQKCLDDKTIKAYRIDLGQFCDIIGTNRIEDITKEKLENVFAVYHKTFKPKTVKRKIASIKAFFMYLEYEELIDKNPFNKIRTSFKEPKTLPRTIALNDVQAFISEIYKKNKNAKTEDERKKSIRDIAVIELLFATGMRISELCTLKQSDVQVFDDSGCVLIHGKGRKERRISLVDEHVLKALNAYKAEYEKELSTSDSFFINQIGNEMSDQSVRRMINNYAKLAGIDQHITPHMFRHTFATSLLENDVDIRYIQELLGHSSISTTEIYTHVSLEKQKQILATKHPRNSFNI